MTCDKYRYEFDAAVSMADVEATLTLALLGTIGLHGETRVRLDGRYAIDRDQRAVVIEAGTDVGQDINLLFAHNARLEFGENGFRVERVSRGPTASTEAKG